MANRRKSVKGYPRLNNCRINPEAFATLNRIAGEHSMGHAIELLCNREELVTQILQSIEKPAVEAVGLTTPEFMKLAGATEGQSIDDVLKKVVRTDQNIFGVVETAENPQAETMVAPFQGEVTPIRLVR